ncbi:hypothetical protein CYMTET_13897 [Cymbomonas tetramitiformis]|uniref:GOLD domain-containing protein n=1 Tax=Cymbomonas tetramitiformis TaxID=36881 RepID=A0AAE0LAR4_9CHLO|nr:hypothetical protein CYMTET_13897 [Cymbomonas tetramitiformis]
MGLQRFSHFAVFLTLVFSCSALEFDLLDRSNTKDQGAKCILEEVNENVLALVEYVSLDGTKISVKIEDPQANIFWTNEGSDKGQYGFTTKLKGDYKICFTKTEPGVGEVTSHKIKLDWKTGVAASDWDSIAKKENVDAITMSLRELEGEIKAVPDSLKLQLELDGLDCFSGVVCWECAGHC